MGRTGVWCLVVYFGSRAYPKACWERYSLEQVCLNGRAMVKSFVREWIRLGCSRRPVLRESKRPNSTSPSSRERCRNSFLLVPDDEESKGSHKHSRTHGVSKSKGRDLVAPRLCVGWKVFRSRHDTLIELGSCELRDVQGNKPVSRYAKSFSSTSLQMTVMHLPT